LGSKLPPTLTEKKLPKMPAALLLTEVAAVSALKHREKNNNSENNDRAMTEK